MRIIHVLITFFQKQSFTFKLGRVGSDKSVTLIQLLQELLSIYVYEFKTVTLRNIWVLKH